MPYTVDAGVRSVLLMRACAAPAADRHKLKASANAKNRAFFISTVCLIGLRLIRLVEKFFTAC